MSASSSRLASCCGLLLIVVVAMSVVGYMLTRFGGMFGSHDVSVYTQVAASLKQSGSLTTRPVYSNGFGYPAFVALLSSFTGISIAHLQLYLMPLFITVPILAAYLAFREMLDIRRGLFATLLLLFHPFFLFSAYRSTHEKFTYAFILLSLYALYMSFSVNSASTRGRYILIGYLSIIPIAFLNVFFATSFVAAVTGSLLLTFVFSQYYGQRLPLRRLGYTLGVSFAVVILVALFLYPPARNFLIALGSVWSQSLHLLFGSAPSSIAGGSSPYASVFTGWNSFWLYLVLISFYIVVYPISGFYWLARMKTYLTQDSINSEQISELFVLVLFVAFGIQLAGAVIADQTGLLGSNMQLRILPLIGFLSVALATAAIFKIIDDVKMEAVKGATTSKLPSLRRTIVPLVVVVLVATFGVTGVVKSTSEPAASHKWVMATNDEQDMIEWTEDYLRNANIWQGYTARIRNSQRIHHPYQPLQNHYEPGTVPLFVQHLSLSDTITKLAEVSNVPLPPRNEAHRTYTNGNAYVYWFERYQTLNEFNDALRRAARG